MSKSTLNDHKKSKMGRPTVDSEQVGIRLQRPILDGIDAYMEDNPSLKNRAAAIRAVLELWLKKNGRLKP